MATKITHLDNSGFLVETPDVFLVFDYCVDPAHNVKNTLKPDYFNKSAEAVCTDVTLARINCRVSNAFIISVLR